MLTCDVPKGSGKHEETAASSRGYYRSVSVFLVETTSDPRDHRGTSKPRYQGGYFLEAYELSDRDLIGQTKSSMVGESALYNTQRLLGIH